MPRALITGITGQDGWYLAELLVRDGYSVVGMVAADDPAPLPPGVERAVGDMRSGEALAAVLAVAEPDEVYNLASISSVGESWARPELVADVNGVGVVRLLHALRTAGRPVRFVQAGSAELFGSAAPPQDESTPIRPGNPYGAAKAFAHHAVASYREAGVWAASAIFFNHESPRRPEHFVTRKITRTVARIAKGADDTLVLGNLDARRDWGFAGDYMRAMTLVARQDEPSDFVIATGVSHSVRDFVAAAFAHVGIADWEEHVVSDPALLRASDAAEQRGDAGRAARELGWLPEVGFGELVAMMVDAERP